MEHGQLVPFEWLYHGDTETVARWRQLESRPGLYALLADWVLQRELKGWEIKALLAMSFRDQMIQLRLPKLPGLAGLLDRLHFDTLDEIDIQRLRFWLQGIDQIPKRLLHMPQVHFDYLVLVMQEPLLLHLPTLTELGIALGDEDAIARLIQNVRQYWSLSLEMGCTEKGVTMRLAKVDSVEDLGQIAAATRVNHWRFRMRREQVQVPLPLMPGGKVVALRTLQQFERLGALQRNCVAQYFRRALQGECAIYCVRDGSRIALTAELEQRDGFWYPKEVLAMQNTIPFTRHVRELLFWLAATQVDGTDEYDYYRNLICLMKWVSEAVLNTRPDDPRVTHWNMLANVLAGLISERANSGYAEQVGLPLGKAESPMELEKQRRRNRVKTLLTRE
jgi:hypothetical protein